ncbi:MAG: phage tail tape measure protein [Herbiconiux sp.]|nr:phage tail tape measure protein [Herbiconiux sp.]
MAERVVKVTLSAHVSQYLAEMEKARKKTVDLGDSLAKEVGKNSASIERLSGGMLALGAAAGAGVALAVAKFADFDQAISSVQAATHESASTMGLLRQAALDAGADTVFSATEAANAIEELSKAGLSSADIMGGALNGSLDLASAGELGVARAAEISSTALQQFKLDGSEASHVADVLAAGAGKAMGSVEDLANGLKFVGPVAESVGVSLDETVGTLALFAQQGIIGEQAGTSLRGVLSSLTSPSAEAASEIEKLGLRIFDSKGKFLGLENAAGELSTAYKGMDDASRLASMGVIFGRETITAATALYQAGAGGVKDWTDSVNDSGYAAETAAIRLDNLKGDVEQLGGALDTALIQTGSGANEILRDLVQNVTAAVDGFSDLPQPVQDSILGVAGFTAGAALLSGAAGFGVVKLGELRDAFTTITTQMPQTAKAIGSVANVLTGPWGLAVGAAAVIGLQFLQINADQQQAVADLTDSLDENTGAFTKNTRQLVINQLEANGTFNLAKKAGIGLDLATDAALGNREAMAEVDRVAKEYAKTVKDGDFDILGSINEDQYETLTDRLTGQNEVLTDAQKKWRDNKEAMGEAGEAADGTAIAIEGVGTISQKAADDIDDLSEKIRNFGKSELDSRQATRDYQQAVDDIAEAMGAEGWTGTLDDAEQAGRDNNAMLDELAEATRNSAAATLDNTGSVDAARAAMAEGRAEYIETATQMGLTADQAAALADQVGLIPTDVVTNVTLTGAESMSEKIASIVSFWESKGIHIPAYVIRQDDAAANRGPDGYATGGTIRGPGTGTSDDVIIRASNGEEIVSAAPAARYRALLQAINSDHQPGLIASLAAEYASNGQVDTNGIRPIGSYADAGEPYGAYGRSFPEARYMSPMPPMVNVTVESAEFAKAPVTHQWNIVAPAGMSPELIGQSAASRANWEAKVLG